LSQQIVAGAKLRDMRGSVNGLWGVFVVFRVKSGVMVLFCDFYGGLCPRERWCWCICVARGGASRYGR